MQNQFQLSGGQPQKQPRYTPIFLDRLFTGIWTQRSPLHDPSDIVTSRFYGGRPDAIWRGSNIELTNRLTLQRRPGLTPFSTATYPTPPNRAFSFELTNGTIQVIVDTGDSPSFAIASVVVAVNGQGEYNFEATQSLSANNAYVGLIFKVEGFGNPTNNGTFVCTQSTINYLVLDNVNVINETPTMPASAISSGAVYYDSQGQPFTSYGFTTIENALSNGGNFTTIFAESSPIVPSSGVCEPSSTGNRCGVYYSSLANLSESFPPGQFSEVTIETLSGSNCIVAPTVCVQPASAGAETFYALYIQGPTGTPQTQHIYVFVAGTPASLTTFTATPQVGDVWRLAVEQGTLTAYQNGVSVGSIADATLTSGFPGFILFNSTAISDTQISSWDAGFSKELLFAKSAGAGQTGFVAVAGTLYMGDGVDTRKYTPMNSNGSIWNYTIAAPTVQPVVTITESGSSAVAWQASTFYSTMGLLVDANGNIEFLTGVNNSGTNTTQYGTTGQGQPQWSNITGNPPATGIDGSCNWLCAGPLKLWAANTSYTAGDCIYVPGIGGTPVPNFSQSNGNNTGSGVRCAGTTGGGVFEAYIQGFNSGNTGTTGVKAPNWNPTSNTYTQDNKVRWQFLGPANLWAPMKKYNSWWEHLEMCVVEPSLPNADLIAAGTQSVFVQTNNNQSTGSANVQGISGTGYTPPWPLAANANPSSVGQTTGDGDLQWICLGWGTWLPSTQFVAWTAGASQFSAIKDGNNEFQVCIQGGLSGGTIPLNGFQILRHYNLAQQIAVSGPSGITLFQVSTAGTTGSSEAAWNYTTSSTTTQGSAVFTSLGLTTSPHWGLTYGTQTTDGNVIWVNVGSALDSTWVSDTQWYLPAIGFAAPTASQAYGGPEVIANGDVQIAINSGLSGSSQPAWGAIGTTTQDNFVTWYTDAVQSTNSLAWTVGHVYAYSYKARSLTDFYSIPSFVYTGPGQSTLQIPIPPGLDSALPPPSGSETGGISTASPVFTIKGANAGAVNSVKVTGSLDPQVDTIVIWRDADGGGPSNMFELTEIPNPKPVNGAPGVAIFQDFLPDVATLSPVGVLFPGLNDLIAAPINDSNDPPPINFIPQVYNFQRIWGISGQQARWSGGPDITNGSNSAEAYNPSNNFPYLANLTRIIKNSQGLVVFITDSVEFIGGGPQTQSFYTVTLAPGIGMSNFNAADIYAGEIFFVSSDSQFKSINPSLQLANLGFPIGDQIALLDPMTVEVAVQQAGTDNAIYVADGSMGWWRVNPHQINAGAGGPEPIWSPFATVVGGAGMVQSVETSPGIKKLLVGSPVGGQQILERNLNVFTDNNIEFNAQFTMGNIVLAHNGQLALLKFLSMDCSGVNYSPVVSYLLNEISGTFTIMPTSIPDPPSIYGLTGTGPYGNPTSYSPNRWYFAATGNLARCRHLQIKVDLGSTSNGDEIFNLCIFGRFITEL